LVVGHRGRPGPLMDALDDIATDPGMETDIWWCFQAQEDAARILDRVFLEQLEQWGATAFFGIDAHELFDEIAPTRTRQPRWPGRIINEISGIELVHVPGGSFSMGSPPDEDGRYDNEGPQHVV